VPVQITSAELVARPAQESDDELLQRALREPDAFAAALTAVPRFRRRNEPATAWLLGIARNILAMSHRSGRVEARARRRLGMPPLILTDDVVERIEALDGTTLERLDALPPRAQEAVRARVVDERDYPDIARDLRCSEAVVRKRVSRGLATLRAQLEERT
jgi:RNA polymerase sigma-70 factor (ECF subfamily)